MRAQNLTGLSRGPVYPAQFEGDTLSLRIRNRTGLAREPVYPAPVYPDRTVVESSSREILVPCTPVEVTCGRHRLQHRTARNAAYWAKGRSKVVTTSLPLRRLQSEGPRGTASIGGVTLEAQADLEQLHERAALMGADLEASCGERLRHDSSATRSKHQTAHSDEGLGPHIVSQSRPDPRVHMVSQVDHQLEELHVGLKQLRMEREHIAAVRTNIDQAASALLEERTAFEANKVSVSMPAPVCPSCNM